MGDGEKLTDEQRRVLERAAADPLGVVTYGYPRGLGSASFGRMMERLVERGLARTYPHGGYEITTAGRAAIGGDDGRTS